MALRDLFKVSRRTFLNPTAWLDFDSLKMQNRTIWQVLSSIFTTPKPERQEDFASAMKRLKLSEADVTNAIKSYRHYALMFFGIGLLIFIYAFYLLFRYGELMGWLLAMAASALFFSQAFKYDFWSLQMKERRLGMTFKEWKASVLGSKGTS